MLIPNCALLSFFLTSSPTFYPWFSSSLPSTVILLSAHSHCSCSSQLKKCPIILPFSPTHIFSHCYFFLLSFQPAQLDTWKSTDWLKFHGPFLPTRKNYSKLTWLCQQFTLSTQKHLIWSQLLLNQWVWEGLKTQTHRAIGNLKEEIKTSQFPLGRKKKCSMSSKYSS